jgi:hypothetical protein
MGNLILFIFFVGTVLISLHHVQRVSLEGAGRRLSRCTTVSPWTMAHDDCRSAEETQQRTLTAHTPTVIPQVLLPQPNFCDCVSDRLLSSSAIALRTCPSHLPSLTTSFTFPAPHHWCHARTSIRFLPTAFVSGPASRINIGRAETDRPGPRGRFETRQRNVAELQAKWQLRTERGGRATPDGPVARMPPHMRP